MILNLLCCKDIVCSFPWLSDGPFENMIFYIMIKFCKIHAACMLCNSYCFWPQKFILKTQICIHPIFYILCYFYLQLTMMSTSVLLSTSLLSFLAAHVYLPCWSGCMLGTVSNPPLYSTSWSSVHFISQGGLQSAVHNTATWEPATVVIGPVSLRVTDPGPSEIKDELIAKKYLHTVLNWFSH